MVVYYCQVDMAGEFGEMVNFNLNEEACGDRPHPIPITVSSNNH